MPPALLTSVDPMPDGAKFDGTIRAVDPILRALQYSSPSTSHANDMRKKGAQRQLIDLCHDGIFPH
jgi:hypothetical protein